MAISVPEVAKNGVINTATNQVSAAFTTNPQSGETIVAVVSVNIATSISINSISMSPGSASFSSLASKYDNLFNEGVEGQAAANITGGTTPTVTCTFSRNLTTSESAAIAIYRVSGMPSSVTTDGTNSNDSTAVSNVCTTAAITTTNNNDIVFAGFCPNTHMTGGQTGWTSSSDGGTWTGYLSEYQIFGSTQSGLTATANSVGASDRFVSVIFALQGASGGGLSVSGTASVTSSLQTTLGYNWTVPGNPLIAGTVSPSLTSGNTLPISITGSPTVAGVTNLSMAIPLSGLSAITGALQPSLSMIGSGLASVTGTIAPTLQNTQLFVTVSGAMGVHGLLTLPQFGTTTQGNVWYLEFIALPQGF